MRVSSSSVPSSLASRAGASTVSVRVAAQHRLHAADELGDAERLGDVVVRAGLEADDLVELGVLRGEHQDVGVAELAHPPADLDAVDVGQAEVEDDQVEGVEGGRFDGGLPVLGLSDVEALLHEQGTDEHPVLGGVVDDKGAGCGGAGHDRPL
jgi:hypothetical protein